MNNEDNQRRSQVKLGSAADFSLDINETDLSLLTASIRAPHYNAPSSPPRAPTTHRPPGASTRPETPEMSRTREGDHREGDRGLDPPDRRRERRERKEEGEKSCWDKTSRNQLTAGER
ncbi:unnamed protein product [Menidia menidia]|uniref:(Atlantic silverside) hypothetical protein n=1 Tax=Menidia menidia TaxID=238744 RepID=A0A8S4BJ27_9TELE|nr:unnamed protein product [Menidia menidia]